MRNPFEFDAAPNIEPRQMVQWFISNHNFSRFVGSSKNVLINGERGSGKSMMLMYYSLRYRKVREELGLIERLDKERTIGIYIPCMTPLYQKQDYLLLPPRLQAYYSEQILVLSIISRIAKEMIDSGVELDSSDDQALKEEIANLLDENYDNSECVTAFHFLQIKMRRKVRNVQQAVKLDDYANSQFFGDTFYDLIIPLLEFMQTLKPFRDKHISLMIDDGQDLNPIQKQLLNSWIGYRDNSVFSLKVAIAGLRHYDFTTNHGSALLEGHDYIVLDLQKPFQNRDSDFGKFLSKVIKARLLAAGIDTEPDVFFRVSKKFVKELESAKSTAELQAASRGLVKGTPAFRNFVYKRNRAIYFAKRASDTSNKPPYSGLDTLQHLSTGVIRNFLQPAFYMFEKQMDERSTDRPPSFITPEIQRDVILSQSDSLWKLLTDGLARKIPNCTLENQSQLLSLFERLGEHFRERLMSDIAEPRVLVFIVSEQSDLRWPDLQHLLDVAEAAQLLYTRVGTSKAGGGREAYYVPNRMLWPRYGLDVHGQHGRASFRVADLWAAAVDKKRLPVRGENEISDPTALQGCLF